MMNVPENELFSAYVDGELTAAEQAEVERLLAASPAARQLVDDLRALSLTLQSLPARTLDEDLSQQILRLAEHRVLSGRTDSDSSPAEPVVPSSRWRAVARRLSRPRIWVWPGLAVAVSLLLIVLQPEQAQRWAGRPAEKHVALAPVAASREPSEPPAIGAVAVADKADLAEKTDLMRSAVRMREEPARPADAPGERVRGVRSRESAPEETRRDAAKAVPSPAAMPAAPSAPPASAPARPMKAVLADLPADARPAKEGLGEGAEKAPEEVTVVLCDVTREAMEQGLVEQALARRHIVLLDRPAKDGLDRGRPAGGGFALTEMEKKSDVAAREADAAEAGDKLAFRLGKAVDSEKIVYLRAEATPEQLEAVLVDLRSQPTVVRSLARESAPAHAVVDGSSPSFLFGRALPTMKQKGDAAPHEAPSTRSADREAARFGQIAEPKERVQANVQNQPAESQAAGGARDAARTQRMLDQPAAANMIQSEAAANLLQDVQVQRRAAEKPGKESQGLHRATGQKAIDAMQATGTRAAGKGATKADPKAAQREQQSDDDLFQTPVDGTAGPAQRAMPAGQAGVMGGYGAPSAAAAEAKPAADASADAKAQGDAKRQVVFVLRSVPPDPIAAEKAAKPQTADAKALAAEATPKAVEAPKPVDSSKPAGSPAAAAAPK